MGPGKGNEGLGDRELRVWVEGIPELGRSRTKGEGWRGKRSRGGSQGEVILYLLEDHCYIIFCLGTDL